MAEMSFESHHHEAVVHEHDEPVRERFPAGGVDQATAKKTTKKAGAKKSTAARTGAAGGRKAAAKKTARGEAQA